MKSFSVYYCYFFKIEWIMSFRNVFHSNINEWRSMLQFLNWKYLIAQMIFNFSETASTLGTLILVYDCISWTCAKVTLLIHSEIDKQKFQMISSLTRLCIYPDEFLICVGKGKLLQLCVLAPFMMPTKFNFGKRLFCQDYLDEEKSRCLEETQSSF